MSEELYVSYVVSQLNMEILLNCIGCEEIYGLFDNISDEVSKEDVYFAVSDMINKRILIPEKNQLVIRAEIREILNIMKNSGSYMKIEVNDEDKRSYIIYRDKGKAAIGTISMVRNASLIISELSVENLYENFIYDILPDTAQTKGFNDDVNIENEDTILAYYDNGLMPDEVLLSVTYMQHDTKIRSKIMIIDNLLDRYVINIVNGMRIRRSYCSKEDCVCYLKENDDSQEEGGVL